MSKPQRSKRDRLQRPFHVTSRALCVTGKVTYVSEQSARKALKKIREGTERRSITPVRSYRCPHCHHWHLTHLQMPTS